MVAKSTFNFNMTKNIIIYIPYVANNITRSILTYYFRHENIGDVIKARMYNKMNNGETYYIALINIQLYSTKSAQAFYTKLSSDGYYRFIYDEEAEHHWLIKQYSSKLACRQNTDDILPVTNDNIPLDFVQQSNFVLNDNSPMKISIQFQDYLYDTLSFESMARDINTTIRNYTKEIYGV